MWWVARPTRDLHDIEDALRAFACIARGKKWYGNKKLQERFEGENPAKTSNVGSRGGRGSGGRTWAAWLRMWGMWYDDRRVTLTDGGELILSGNPEKVHNQIVHMIMTFQITSYYHNMKRPRTDPGFMVFPFRFMIRLLLDRRVKYLSIDEVGLFLLYARADDEYERTVSKILDWRGIGDGDKRSATMGRIIKRLAGIHGRARSDAPDMEDVFWRGARDVASTLVKNLSYINEIHYDQGEVRVSAGGSNAVMELLKKYENVGFSTTYHDSEKTFMARFGRRYDRRKASKKETEPMTPARKRKRRITEAVAELRRTNPGYDGDDLIKRIQEITHYSTSDIEKAISENPDVAVVDQDDADFIHHYMECATNGDEHAEFESLTRKIFSRMGFDTKKSKVARRKGGSLEIDGLITNKYSELSGILECKSGSRYAFSVADSSKMQTYYIPAFRRKRVGGVTYNLDFFVYVIGSKVSGLGNFQDIVEKADVDGSVIYAADLIMLYCLFLQGKVSAIRAWGLFKSNKHIRRSDIENLM